MEKKIYGRIGSEVLVSKDGRDKGSKKGGEGETERQRVRGREVGRMIE